MPGAKLGDDPLCHLHMLRVIRIRIIHDLQQQIRLRHLFECRFKGLDQRCRQLLNKPDRVRNQEILAVSGLDAPDRRIQSRKQHIVLKHLFLFPRIPVHKGIHNRGLACIGITHQGYQRDRSGLAAFSLCRTLTLHENQLTPQLCKPVVDLPAVKLQLRLAFALAGLRARCAALTVLGLPHSDQPGLDIFQPRQLDLKHHITETETDTSIHSFSWLPALPHFTLILPLGPSIRYRNNILT